jgi:hypothetical protein
LLWQLLQQDVDLRLQFCSNIRKHPFFAKIDWEALAMKTLEPPFKPSIEQHMADTIVMPNVNRFLGFTYASPSPISKT